MTQCKVLKIYTYIKIAERTGSNITHLKGTFTSVSNLSLQKLLRKKKKKNYKSDLTIIQLNEKIFIFHHNLQRQYQSDQNDQAFKVFLISVCRLFDDTAATAIIKGPNHVPNPWIVLDFPFSLVSISLYLSSVSTERDFLCRREERRGRNKSARVTMKARAYIFLLFHFYWNTQREPLRRTENHTHIKTPWY